MGGDVRAEGEFLASKKVDGESSPALVRHGSCHLGSGAGKAERFTEPPVPSLAENELDR